MDGDDIDIVKILPQSIVNVEKLVKKPRDFRELTVKNKIEQSSIRESMGAVERISLSLMQASSSPSPFP